MFCSHSALLRKMLNTISAQYGIVKEKYGMPRKKMGYREIALQDEYIEKLEKISEKNHRTRPDQVRFWIDQELQQEA